MKLLIATRNPGKVKEFADMMAGWADEWLTLSDAGVDFEVEETGTTFQENAVLKARTYARAAGLMTLADDSGLEVDALDGAPGVYTARYGGPELSHEERYQYLLKQLKNVPAPQRRARFRAVLALADPQGEILLTVEGICPGMIAPAPRGSFGFGYDPIFIPDGQGGRTMAELPPHQKHPISHRGRAIQVLVRELNKGD